MLRFPRLCVYLVSVFLAFNQKWDSATFFMVTAIYVSILEKEKAKQSC